MSYVSREIHTRQCYCTVFTILSVVIVFTSAVFDDRCNPH